MSFKHSYIVNKGGEVRIPNKYLGKFVLITIDTKIESINILKEDKKYIYLKKLVLACQNSKSGTIHLGKKYIGLKVVNIKILN